MDETDLLYTNTQFYAFIDPFNSNLPYLYDEYKWSHCDSTYPVITTPVPST